MKKFTLLMLLLFALFQVQAQEIAETEKKGFLIVAAGTNYEAMKTLAVKASENLNYKLDYRGLIKDETLGLSINEEECEQHGFEFPSYIARGRSDDGNYVSVEYTNAYEGFTPGYYILVVSSYAKGSNELAESLKFVKTHYKTAYVKYADIYVGCIH